MPRLLTLLLTVALAWSAAVGIASASIQSDVDAAADGATVTIAAGVHPERVVITGKSLRLVGAGAASVLQPSAGAQPVIEVDTAGEHVVLENLTVDGGGGALDGIVVTAGSATLSAVTATGFAAGAGITSSAAERIDVIASTFTSNAVGADLGATPGTLRGNRITGNTTGLVASAVDAARNWWGCNGGPLAAGCDTTSGGAIATPHLVLRLRSAFAQIPTGGATTQIVADLTRDSADTFAGTFFPEATTVSFGAALGSLDPVAAPISGAAAATTLTSGDTAGNAAPSVTLDQQTLSVPVAFVAPAPPQTVTVTVPQEPTTQTVTVTVPQTPATTETAPPPPTTPASADGTKLLADARRAIGSRVVRLERVLLPGIAYVARSVRKGTGTLTIDDEDVVPLLVLVCPDEACDAGVSANVTRTARSGRKAKPYALRRATFDLAAGRQRVVAVRLTRARREAIKAARRATMTVTIAVSDQAGNRNKTTMRFALKVRP